MVEGAAGVRAAQVDGVYIVNDVRIGRGGARADRFDGLAGASSATIAQYRSEGDAHLNARLERAVPPRTLHGGRLLPVDQVCFGRHLDLSKGLATAAAEAGGVTAAAARLSDRSTAFHGASGRSDPWNTGAAGRSSFAANMLYGVCGNGETDKTMRRPCSAPDSLSLQPAADAFARELALSAALGNAAGVPSSNIFPDASEVGERAGTGARRRTVTTPLRAAHAARLLEAGGTLSAFVAGGPPLPRTASGLFASEESALRDALAAPAFASAAGSPSTLLNASAHPESKPLATRPSHPPSEVFNVVFAGDEGGGGGGDSCGGGGGGGGGEGGCGGGGGGGSGGWRGEANEGAAGNSSQALRRPGGWLSAQEGRRSNDAPAAASLAAFHGASGVSSVQLSHLYFEGGPQRRHAATLTEGAQAQRALFGCDATHVVGALLASGSEGAHGATGPYFEGAFGKGLAAVV